jgi:hypothetical protein
MLHWLIQEYNNDPSVIRYEYKPLYKSIYEKEPTETISLLRLVDLNPQLLTILLTSALRCPTRKRFEQEVTPHIALRGHDKDESYYLYFDILKSEFALNLDIVFNTVVQPAEERRRPTEINPSFKKLVLAFVHSQLGTPIWARSAVELVLQSDKTTDTVEYVLRRFPNTSLILKSPQ